MMRFTAERLAARFGADAEHVATEQRNLARGHGKDMWTEIIGILADTSPRR
jgi:hypothetical protein